MSGKIKAKHFGDRSHTDSIRSLGQKNLKADQDQSLTSALEDTFPASDPISSLRFTRQSKPSA